jgi:hypothetical protein
MAANNESNIYIANPSAILTFDQQQNLQTLQQALNVDVSGSFGGDRFSTSLAAEFANASKDNSYTTNIIYLYQYAGIANFKPGTLGQGINALTPVAQSFVESNIPFQTMCGDSFVSQMNAGVTLAVRLTLSFNSALSQSEFKANLQANLGLASITTAIQTAATQSGQNISFSLSALQLGGEPQNLNQIFGQPGSGGDYPFVDCGSTKQGGNPTACNAMVDAIVNYAQTLPGQISNSDGALNLNNLYYTNPAYEAYSSLGIPHGAVNPDAQTLQAMQTLTQQYDQTVYNYNLVNHYLNTMSLIMDPASLEALTDAQQWLGNQLQDVYLDPYYQLLNCYKGYVSDSCVNIEQNINNAIQTNYPLPSLESKEITYLDTHSYTAQLMDYNESTNVYYPQSCVLAPIADPDTNLYAVNCDGYWMTSPAGLYISQNNSFGANVMNISGLSYSTYGQPLIQGDQKYQTISYDNGGSIALNPSGYFGNKFTESGITVQTGSAGATIPNFTLNIVQWAHSQS